MMSVPGLSPAKVLRRARTLIRKGWTQGEYARDAAKHPVNSQHEDAACFCAIGAIKRACFELGATPGVRERCTEFMFYVVKQRGYEGIVDWNDADKRKKKDVIAGFDDAIAKAEEARA